MEASGAAGAGGDAGGGIPHQDSGEWAKAGGAPEGTDRSAGGLHTTMDYVEEYALLFVFAAVVLYFVLKKMRQGVDHVAYEIKSRNAEESIRRAREAQQARYWEETAAKREELERLQKEREAAKLEDMAAAHEGRTSKNKKAAKAKDTRDYWDNSQGFNHMNPGGGGGGGRGYKPSGIQRRGGG